MSELVRQRCTQKPTNKDEELLAVLVSEVNRATIKAKESLNTFLSIKTNESKTKFDSTLGSYIQ